MERFASTDAHKPGVAGRDLIDASPERLDRSDLSSGLCGPGRPEHDVSAGNLRWNKRPMSSPGFGRGGKSWGKNFLGCRSEAFHGHPQRNRAVIKNCFF